MVINLMDYLFDIMMIIYMLGLSVALENPSQRITFKIILLGQLDKAMILVKGGFLRERPYEVGVAVVALVETGEVANERESAHYLKRFPVFKGSPWNMILQTV